MTEEVNGAEGLAAGLTLLEGVRPLGLRLSVYCQYPTKMRERKVRQSLGLGLGVAKEKVELRPEHSHMSCFCSSVRNGAKSIASIA